MSEPGPRRLRLDVEDEAVAIFEQYLITAPAPCEQGIEALCRRHPDYRPSLEELWEVHQRCQSAYLSIQPKLPSEAPPPLPSRRRRWSLQPALVSVGVLMVVAGLFAWGFREEFFDSAPASQKPELAALPEPATELETALELGRSLVELVEFSRATDADRTRSLSAEELADCAELVGVGQRLQQAFTEEEVEAPEDRDRWSALADRLAEQRAWAEERATELGAELPPANAAPFAASWLPRSPRMTWMIQSTFRDLPLPSATPRLDEALRIVQVGRRTARLELRVFDLDRDGQRVSAPEIHAQRVDSEAGALSESRQLDPEARWHELEVGDWRLTVIDRPSRRHGVLRVFLPPGASKRRPMFLRRVEDDGSMVRFGASSFEYGGEGMRTHISPRTVQVSAFWMGRTEVTKREFEEFWAHWELRPDWQEAWSDGDGEPAPADPARDWPWSGGDKGVMPAVGIEWELVQLYCMWRGCRLPTDREWEFVATNGGRWDYPWGPEWDPAAVTKGRVGPVHLPAGATPGEEQERIYRLADNVGELVEDVLILSSAEGVSTLVDFDGLLHRISRGSNFRFIGDRWKARQRGGCARSNFMTGWRCARSPFPELPR